MVPICVGIVITSRVEKRHALVPCRVSLFQTTTYGNDTTNDLLVIDTLARKATSRPHVNDTMLILLHDDAKEVTYAWMGTGPALTASLVTLDLVTGQATPLLTYPQYTAQLGNGAVGPDGTLYTTLFTVSGPNNGSAVWAVSTPADISTSTAVPFPEAAAKYPWVLGTAYI